MVKMKRIITALLLAVIAAAPVLTACSPQKTETSSVAMPKATEPMYRDKLGIGYNETKDGTLTISNYKGSGDTLTIPSEYKDKKVTEIGKSSFKMAPVKKVIVPDTVLKLDNYCFAFSRSLEEIVIPDSVKEIGVNAFAGCVHLKKIKLPEKLRKIGIFAFDATDIKEVTIPKNVKKIDDYAFAECRSLKNVVFNSKNTEIAKTAFNKSDKVVITAPKDSKAIKFAKSHSLKYKIK